MALNFPDSPTLNQVYTDTVSGFSFKWDGTVWQSYTPAAAKNINVVDDIAGSFNGSTQTFALAVSTVSLTPASAQQLIVVLGGIVQEPGVDYTVSGSNITFTDPPAAGLNVSIVSIGPAVPVFVLEDGTVTPAKLSTGGPSWNTGSGFNVAGITTLGSSSGVGTVRIGSGSTTLIVEGDARVTGILTVGTSSITLNGVTDRINVGTGLTLSSAGIQAGVVTATTVNATNITGGAATFTGNVSIAGTLTYEDVTNIDSVGLVTARSGINVTGGSIVVSSGGLSVSGVTTVAAGSVSVPSISPTGDNNTGIFFPEADTIAFTEGGVEAVRFSSNGNIGIGTTNPGARLQVNGSAVKTSSDGVLTLSSGDATNPFQLVFQRSASTDSVPVWSISSVDQGVAYRSISLQPQGGNIILGAGGGYTGIGTNSPDKALVVKASGGNFVSEFTNTNNASNNNGVYISVQNTASSTQVLNVSSGGSTRLLITGAGNIGIGSDNPTEKLHVIGNILASGNVTGYSDETLKDNVKTISDALDKVIQLRGVEYDRNDIEGNPHQIGVIAQEVEKVVPEVVTTHEDGIKSVAYGNLVGLLIEAVKDLKEEVNELKARLEEI